MPTTKRAPTRGAVTAATIAAELPKLNPAVVDALQDMLLQDQGMTKPPEQAARLLALCVELHRQHKPFPTRDVAAKALGGSQSRFTVDAILSQRMNQGYLSMVVETTQGNVTNRDSVRKQRFYVPDRRTLDIAARARRRMGED